MYENNDDGQHSITASKKLSCLSDEEIRMRKNQSPLLSSRDRQTETITNIRNGLVDNNNPNTTDVTTNLLDSNSLLLLSSLSISTSSSSSSSCTMLATTNEHQTTVHLPKEKEAKKEEEKEQQQYSGDDYIVDKEKENNSNVIHDHHTSGIILRNDKPRQTALLQQEKKEKVERERPSSSLPTLDQLSQQRTEDESPIQTLPNDLNQILMDTIDQNDEQYKKVEIEEVPDDEETVQSSNNDVIEPTDYILTDDEPNTQRQTSPQSNTTTKTNENPIILDENVFSCYEKALAKVVDGHDESLQQLNTSSQDSSVTTQQSVNDPIALRALQRFEERMNAAAAVAKTNTTEANQTVTKGKSSWSGSLSTSRKSLENLFKTNEQPLSSTAVSADDESTTVNLSSQCDSYIRPRKTFDDSDFNYGTALNLVDKQNSTIDETHNNVQQVEDQQQQPSTTIRHDDKRGE